jgi:iron complex outermembrane receptor protein
MNVEITSVSKRPEPVSKAPASVYVITSEDIRRSGAVSLPDALRLAPNLTVARVTANTYAISSRGFNSFESSNKLLVLIDGRSIYTPLHAGVFWDQQQVMLEDIDRIEVISGPGGTLWGANAVNGVINVITKNTSETQGALVNTQLGNKDQRGVARFGGQAGEHLAYRAYVQDAERSAMDRSDGSTANDAWDNEQAGFRADWTVPDNTLTLQGDLFANSFDVGGRTNGKNFLTRWTNKLAAGSSLEIQGYYDQVERKAPGAYESAETFDLQAQHSFPVGESQQIVWGGGYRYTTEELSTPGAFFILDPPKGTVSLGNVFLQDRIELTENLALTLGTKLEHSSFTGLEYLPSARLAWEVSETSMLWAAVSRAVRTPSRIERNLVAPGLVQKATDFTSENLTAYEVGYRGQPTTDSSISITFFYHDYEELRVLSQSPSTGLFYYGNDMEGSTYGVEIWGDYKVQPWWRLSAGFTETQKNLTLLFPASTASLQQHTGNDPDYQISLRSSMDLGRDWTFDVGMRFIDDLPTPVVPGYTALDARVAWAVTHEVELSLSGFNLLDNRHAEAGPAGTRVEVPLTVLAGVRWRL